MEDAIVNIVIAVCGLLVGLFGAGSYLTKRLDGKIEKEQKRADIRRQQETERCKIRMRREHALGRMLFWLERGIRNYEKEFRKGFWNGELEAAFHDYVNAENEEKELDREDLASINKGE